MSWNSGPLRRLGRSLPGQVMKAGPRLKLHPMDDVQTAVG